MISEPQYYCEWANLFWRKKQKFKVICKIEYTHKNGKSITLYGRSLPNTQPRQIDLKIFPNCYDGLSFFGWSLKRGAESALADVMLTIRLLQRL